MYPKVPALKCRATFVASLVGRRSDDLIMIHQTNLLRLQILRQPFCSNLKSAIFFRSSAFCQSQDVKLRFNA